MGGSTKYEDEWFAKYEIQLIRDAKRKREQIKKGEKEGTPQLPANYMLCPVDGQPFKTKLIGEVEINICPSCEGIWLDRGELESIIIAHQKDRKGFFRKLLGFE